MCGHVPWDNPPWYLETEIFWTLSRMWCRKGWSILRCFFLQNWIKFIISQTLVPWRTILLYKFDRCYHMLGLLMSVVARFMRRFSIDFQCKWTFFAPFYVYSQIYFALALYKKSIFLVIYCHVLVNTLPCYWGSVITLFHIDLSGTDLYT